MKTIAKEMPLDQFAKEMNALNQPFHVWAIYNGVPGADFESSINATKMELWTLPGNDLKQASITFRDGTGNRIEFTRTSKMRPDTTLTVRQSLYPMEWLKPFRRPLWTFWRA